MRQEDGTPFFIYVPSSEEGGDDEDTKDADLFRGGTSCVVRVGDQHGNRLVAEWQ
jgi:hypothetical protein